MLVSYGNPDYPTNKGKQKDKSSTLDKPNDQPPAPSNQEYQLSTTDIVSIGMGWNIEAGFIANTIRFRVSGTTPGIWAYIVPADKLDTQPIPGAKVSVDDSIDSFAPLVDLRGYSKKAAQDFKGGRPRAIITLPPIFKTGPVQRPNFIEAALEVMTEGMESLTGEGQGPLARNVLLAASPSSDEQHLIITSSYQQSLPQLEGKAGIECKIWYGDVLHVVAALAEMASLIFKSST